MERDIKPKAIGETIEYCDYKTCTSRKTCAFADYEESKRLSEIFDIPLKKIEQRPKCYTGEWDGRDDYQI